jgi:predicted nucleic acid binding AN1-type Zn finger protein
MEYDAQPSTSPDGSAQGLDIPLKKKQKRNKPTLSCEECVERKTKVSACLRSCSGGCATWTTPGLCKNTMAESARSVIAPDQIVWRASSDSRHVGIPALQT